MEFMGINYMAVLAAGIAGYAFGAVYYMLLGKAWLKAQDKTEADIKGPNGEMDYKPFIIAAVAALFMAFMLAGVMGHLGETGFSLRGGLISGVFMWSGFVLTTTLVNHAYQGQKLNLTAIDLGHWLGVLLIQGAIIGLMGV